MSESLQKKKCRGCDADIFFVKDAAGKIHPLDAKAPTWTIERDMMGETIAVRAQAYVSHFSTCPKANDFGQSKGPSTPRTWRVR